MWKEASTEIVAPTTFKGKSWSSNFSGGNLLKIATFNGESESTRLQGKKLIWQLSRGKLI